MCVSSGEAINTATRLSAINDSGDLENAESHSSPGRMSGIHVEYPGQERAGHAPVDIAGMAAAHAARADHADADGTF
jgi:hypothetical protein